MKTLTAFVVLFLAISVGHAQFMQMPAPTNPILMPAAPPPPPPIPAAAANAAQLAQAASVAKMPAGPWAGKLDLLSPPSLAAYQSFTSLDQAVGFQKNLWSVSKGPYEVIRFGLFVGYYKPIFSNSSPKTLGGATVLVPGSVLDWAMGTNYGAQWLPALKTGILVGYDLTHPKTLHARPDFAGPGVTYAWGGK